MSYPTFKGRRIVVGICGSIAAYKACDVISSLRQAEADLRVVMTRNATQFVGLATLRTLSGQDVACEMFGEMPAMEIEHVSLAEFGEVLVIVAETANVIGKVAGGICDDLLTTTINAAAGKVVFAPAMNWRMWENPITQRNVTLLTELGCRFVGPDTGHLACGETGIGRLCGTEDILDAVDQALGPTDSKLRGKRVLITGGPTREWLDPVRFISNPSTGKMAFALAQEALVRGAAVAVVSGPTAQRPPLGAEVVCVDTTEEMLREVVARCDESDVIVGAAAPADFRPATRAEEKVKKAGGPATIALEQTPDIMAEIGRNKGERIHVAFAAETSDLEVNALVKLKSKNADLVVANDLTRPGAGFAGDTNEATIYDSQGEALHVPRCAKREVAMAVLDEVERLL